MRCSPTSRRRREDRHAVASAPSSRRWPPGSSAGGRSKIVLDPVMIAASGDRLLAPDADRRARARLIPRALVDHAEHAGSGGAARSADRRRPRRRCVRKPSGCWRSAPQAVLIKGGHGGGSGERRSTGRADGVRAPRGGRIATTNTHGTGCTLSSAIAAGLAKGSSSAAAVRAAKAYLTARSRRRTASRSGRATGRFIISTPGVKPTATRRGGSQ